MNREKVTKYLNKLISECLFAPAGDPGWSELFAAATAVVIMNELELEVNHRKDVEVELRGQNVYDKDFIKEIEE